jgi:hypothetical protein
MQTNVNLNLLAGCLLRAIINQREFFVKIQDGEDFTEFKAVGIQKKIIKIQTYERFHQAMKVFLH